MTREPVRRYSASASSSTSPLSWPRLLRSASLSCGRAVMTAVRRLCSAWRSRLSCRGESRASAAAPRVTAAVAMRASSGRGRRPKPGRGRRGRPRSALPDPVPRPPDREDERGLLRALLELLPEVADVDVDGTWIAVGAIAPDRPQELLTVEQVPRARHETGKQLVFREGQLDGLAAQLHLAIAAIQRHLAHLDDVLVEHAAVRAAHHGSDAAAQLTEAEGLGDVVVGARLQPEHDVRL